MSNLHSLRFVGKESIPTHSPIARVLPVVMLLAGCASSIMIHRQDSVALKTVKVTARVAEAIPTFGLVEVYYACARDLCSAVNGACDTTPGVAARAWWACHDHMAEQFLAAAQTMNQIPR